MRSKCDKIPARSLTNEEIQVVLVSFQGKHAPRNRALFIFLLKTGFRISEVLSLRVEDVFQHNRVLDIVTVRKADMKGKSSSRTVRLHHLVKESLAEYIAIGRMGQLFPIGRMQAWRIVDGAYQGAKIPSPHGLHATRKTFAQSMYRKLNFDLVKTAKAIGHKSIQSTVSYLAIDDQEITEAILSDDDTLK
jgi:integrase